MPDEHRKVALAEDVEKARKEDRNQKIRDERHETPGATVSHNERDMRRLAQLFLTMKAT